MNTKRIYGVVALGLAATAGIRAQDADSPTATTPPVEIPSTAEAPDPEKAKSDASYALGYRTGGEFAQNYARMGITAKDLDRETFLKGFFDAFEGDAPGVDDEKINAAMQAFGDFIQSREQELAAENLEKGEAFLEANAEKEGVKTTESGLQYQVLEAGGEETYEAPEEGEPKKQFMVEYRGTLIDGTEFDASPEDQSIPMNLNVIDGIKEALTSMPVGAKWRVFIPSDLAYGEQRRSAEIGPNTALIFELELKEIKDAPAAPGGGFQLPVPQGR
jgi:FKBP-type peptidyl-prolyl cis-trans isomerase